MKDMTKLLLVLAALLMVGLTVVACGTPVAEEVAEPVVVEEPVAVVEEPTIEVITEPLTMTEGLTLTEGITVTEGMTETEGMAPAGPITLMLASDLTLGDYLTDEAGRVVYVFTDDLPNTSTCTGACLESWPPVLTDGDPIAGNGLDETMLGAIELADGTMQVTYNEWPLYYYVEDVAAGDMYGQAAELKWYVMSPMGEAVTGE